MTDILALMDKAERLQAELHETQRQIVEAVNELACDSAAIALTSAAKVLRKVTGVEGIPPATRVEARSARRMVEAQLGWPAA
jgi:hypothetical protein